MQKSRYNNHFSYAPSAPVDVRESNLTKLVGGAAAVFIIGGGLLWLSGNDPDLILLNTIQTLRAYGVPV